MSPTSAPFHDRIHLVQVGPYGDISAIAEQLDGACLGRWNVTSSASLEEFLARPGYEFPQGTPLIRLDLSGLHIYRTRVIGGPGWLAEIPAGHVEMSPGRYRRYAGECWEQLSGSWLAGDVYADLAPAAGVIVERLAGQTTRYRSSSRPSRTR